MVVTDLGVPNAVHDLETLLDEGYASLQAHMAEDALRIEDGALLELLALCRGHDTLVQVHAESHGLISWSRRRLLTAGRTGVRYQALARPAVAEREATQRAVALAELVDVPVLLGHVSSAAALDEIGAARRRGQPVLGETCPQYLTLTEESLGRPDGAKFVCRPPLRSADDQGALWRALADGTLSVVASHHAAFLRAHHAGAVDERGQPLAFDQVPAGLPGLECRLPLLLTHGVAAGRLSLQTCAAVCAANPAKLHGLYPRKGTLAVGSDADLCLWDLSAEWTITRAALHDVVDHTPYEGMRMRAAPLLTLLRGRVAFRRSAIRGALNVAALDEVLVTEGQGERLPCGRPQLVGCEDSTSLHDRQPWPRSACAVLDRADAWDCKLRQAHGGSKAPNEQEQERSTGRKRVHDTSTSSHI